MFFGMILGFLVGLIICLICGLFSFNYFLEKMNINKIVKIIMVIALIFCIIAGAILGIYYDNYDLKKKIANFESIRITYSSVDTISEYDRISILQKVMEANQDMAETKVYVNSWISFGISKENKEAINNLKLIGE